MPAKFSKPQTLFEKVQDGITTKIRDGVWTPDQPIPNEIELAKLFDVSQGTVRRALKELTELGILYRRQGKGTFITTYKRDMASIRPKINWFVPDNPEKLHHRVEYIVSLKQVSPTARHIQWMKCDPQQKLWQLKREMTYAEGDPIQAFDEVYLLVDRFPDLRIELFTEEHLGLYEVYERYGYHIADMEDIARAVLLNPEQAKKAQVPLPYPALCQQRRSWDMFDRLIELRYIINTTDTQTLVLRRSNQHDIYV